MKENWYIKTLGSLATFINGDRGSNYPSHDDFVKDGIPFINAGHLINGTVSLSEMNYITEEKFNILSRGKIQKDDILFCLRGSLGKHAIVQNISKGAIASSLVIIRCSEYVLPAFVSYYLDDNSVLSSITKENTGSNQPNLSAKTMMRFQIPCPNISEQKRIVGILDAEFEKIDALKANAEKNLQNAIDLFQAALKKELEPKNGWKTHSIEEVSAKIFAGGDVPKDSLSKVQTTKYNVPIVSNGIEQDGLYGYTEFAKVNEPAITISGRGTIGYVVERLNPFYPIVRLITIIPKLDEIITRYLYYSLRNVDFSHTGSSIPQLTVPMVKDKTISVPTVAEQEQIAFRLDTLSAKCKELQDNYTQTLTLCDDLKQALLRKAFNGEL